MVRMVKRIRKTTSHRTARSYRYRKYQHAFTLVEILIVLAVIALIVALGIPAIQAIVSQRLSSTTRRFVGTIRTIRNDSILLSRVHRLVINMDDQTWWVEGQRKFELLSEEPEENEDEEKISNFAFVEKYATKPIELPEAIGIGAVVKEREGFLRDGLAYIHFFPNGYSEPAQIFITRRRSLEREGDEAGGFVLDIAPTGGRVEIFTETLGNLAREHK